MPDILERETGRTRDGKRDAVRLPPVACPSHGRLSGARWRGKPERHRAHGRGRRASRTAHGCADVSGRRERHGGRLPLRSWHTVRQSVRRDRHGRHGEPSPVRQSVRRDRAQGKPERHRANGAGHGDAAADRDGREPVRHTGTARRAVAVALMANRHPSGRPSGRRWRQIGNGKGAARSPRQAGHGTRDNVPRTVAPVTCRQRARRRDRHGAPCPNPCPFLSADRGGARLPPVRPAHGKPSGAPCPARSQRAARQIGNATGTQQGAGVNRTGQPVTI